MTVSIVIPVFGPEYFLTACLTALTDNTEGDYETVVVDNGTGYDLALTPEPRAIVVTLRILGLRWRRTRAPAVARANSW